MVSDINPTVNTNINTTKGPENNEGSKNKYATKNITKKGTVFNLFGKVENHYNDDGEDVDKTNQSKDLIEEAKEWFESIEGPTPPFVIGHYKGSDAEKHDKLEKAFVDYIDRNFNEFPPKKQRYEILDRLKVSKSYFLIKET